MKLNIKSLVIAPQPFFSFRGTPFSVYYRTLVTSEAGIKIDLLTYGEGRDVDIPGVRIIRIPQFRMLGKVKIGPSFLKLFLDVWLFLWTVALLIKNKYNYVHAHEEAVFFSLLLKPLAKFKLIYDMHSSLPQQLKNFKFTTSSILIKIFQYLEDWSLRKSDAIITICPDLYKYVQTRVNEDKRNILIENSIFEPVKFVQTQALKSESNVIKDKIRAIKNWKEENKLDLVVYAGTLEPYQGIDILIKSFQNVVGHISNAGLVIVGGTKHQVDSFSKLAQSCGLANQIRFTGQLPQSAAKHISGLASVLASPRSEGTNTPLKIYEQLASGIPLVATNIYSHTQVLDSGVAYLVQPEPLEMAKGIIAALDEKGSRNKIAQNAQKLYIEKYSRPIYEKKLKSVLELVG